MRSQEQQNREELRRFKKQVALALLTLLVVVLGLRACEAQPVTFKTEYIKEGSNGKKIKHPVKWVYDDQANTLAYAFTDSLHTNVWRYPLIYNVRSNGCRKMIMSMSTYHVIYIPVVLRFKAHDPVYVRDEDIPNQVVIQWHTNQKPIFYL